VSDGKGPNSWDRKPQVPPPETKWRSLRKKIPAPQTPKGKHKKTKQKNRTIPRTQRENKGEKDISLVGAKSSRLEGQLKKSKKKGGLSHTTDSLPRLRERRGCKKKENAPLEKKGHPWYTWWHMTCLKKSERVVDRSHAETQAFSRTKSAERKVKKKTEGKSGKCF